MTPLVGSDPTAGIETLAVPPRAVLNAATMNSKVFVALPWYKQTNPITAFCVMGLVDRRRTSTCLNFGDAFVAHSRNTCADLFLSSNCEWMLMIDDDMIIPFGNAKWFNAYSDMALPEKFAGMHAVDRLLSHGKSLVGGLYWGRHKHGACMYAEAAAIPKEAAFARTAPLDMIKPTRWVATGCLLVHRTVFESIEKKFPRLARGLDGKGGNWFTSTEHNLLERIDECRKMLSEGPMDGNKALKAYQMLETAAKEARHQSALGMGEDVSLCVRAAAAGHQPHVDLGLVCGHIGHQIFGPQNTFPR